MRRSFGVVMAALGYVACGDGSAWAQARTLQDALAAAYSTNPTLLAARAQLRVVDEGVPQALSGWRPTVIVAGTIGYGTGESLAFSRTTSSGYTAPTARTGLDRQVDSAQATVTQPLYTGGNTRATTNQATNRVYAQRARLIATEQQVFTNVVTSFVNVISTQQVLQLNINNEQVLTRQLQATNDRFRVGEITRTDVAQAEAALAGARATRQTAEGNLQTARATYRQYVGALPDQLIEPQPIKLPVRNQAEVTQLAAANNPNVIAALFDDAASKDSIDVAFSALMPTLSLVGQAARTDNSLQPRTQGNTAQLILNGSVPIYQGGAEYSRIRQARQTQQQTRRVVDDARRQAVQQAASTWETLIAARGTIESTNAQIRANQIALEGVQREAIVGSRTTLDVLNAEQLLLNSRVVLVQNLANLVNNSYAVAQAIGRLTARDLALNVPLYDETAYYNAVKNKLYGTADYATGQQGR